MLEKAVEFVRKNSRTKTIIADNGRQTNEKEYPIKTVREATLNALDLCGYSIHTKNTPISLVMYRDRMEIINSADYTTECQLMIWEKYALIQEIHALPICWSY